MDEHHHAWTSQTRGTVDEGPSPLDGVHSRHSAHWLDPNLPADLADGLPGAVTHAVLRQYAAGDWHAPHHAADDVGGKAVDWVAVRVVESSDEDGVTYSSPSGFTRILGQTGWLVLSPDDWLWTRPTLTTRTTVSVGGHHA